MVYQNKQLHFDELEDDKSNCKSYLDSLLLDGERTLPRLHTVRVCLSRVSIINLAGVYISVRIFCFALVNTRVEVSLVEVTMSVESIFLARVILGVEKLCLACVLMMRFSAGEVNTINGAVGEDSSLILRSS